MVTAAGKAHEGIHKRRGVVASPGDPDFLDDRLFNADLTDPADRMGGKFLRRKEGQSEASLHHVERGGGAGRAADNIRLEAGSAAGGKA